MQEKPENSSPHPNRQPSSSSSRVLSPLPGPSHFDSAAETAFSMLVVDDDENVRELIASSLSHIQITPAATASEGLEFLGERSFDLALIDLGLPDRNGFEVIIKIKANPELESMPVMILTGSKREEDRIRGFDLGAADYINKPIGVQELRARVNAVLRQKRLQDRLVQSNRSLAEALKVSELSTRSRALFLANLSHAVRKPIGEIQEALQNLRDSQVGDAFNSSCDAVDQSAQKLTGQLQDLFQFFKMETGIAVDAAIKAEREGDTAESAVPSPKSAASLEEEKIETAETKAEEMNKEAPLAPSPKTPKQDSPPARRDTNGRPPIDLMEIDMERLKDFGDDDPESMKELIDLYLDQAFDHLSKLKEAIQNGDAPETRRIAHCIAGASGSCGLIGLLEAFRRIEELARQDQAGSARELFAGAEQAVRQIKDYFDQYFKQRGVAAVS